MANLTKSQAYAQAERLAHHLRRYGLKVVIDLKPGANGVWGVDTFYAPMMHHIVSKRIQGTTPFYQLVRTGRSDVPGPLCNVYLGWDHVVRIVTMGIANHSGAGGPWNISGFIIPRNNGRYYFLGSEIEGGWIEEDWDDDFRLTMGKLAAGKLDYLNELRGGIISDTALTEHSMWARPKGRKIDRLGYTHEKAIAEMRAARQSVKESGVGGVHIPPEEDLNMPKTLYTFFFINGKHHVVNNVTGVYYEVPLNEVDSFTIWLRKRGAEWDWHDPEGKREVKPSDLTFVAPGGKGTWGKGVVPA